jgi:hypothetical protein
MIACEDCGAAGHGNINCIRCVRWLCRTTVSPFYRYLIKLWERRLGIYHPDAWKPVREP